MTLLRIDIVKLLVALFLGRLTGAEREFRDKAAGFRTPADVHCAIQRDC